MATTTPPSPATCQTNFEQAVALSLNLWPALTLAVQNNWGGSDSRDKRDWFAGAVVDLFADLSTLSPAQLLLLQQSQNAPQSQQTQTQSQSESTDPDQEDVESVLLQVMLDEFEVNVDDDSAFELAEQVVRLRGECVRGRFDGVEALRRRWEGSAGKKVVMKQAENKDDEDTDWDSEDDDDEEGGEDGDVEMGEAPPALVKVREEPEVDEDGFTKVTRKKR
ncbi:putative 20S pre-rRNA protein [Staphylotrichum tortipilum]|uniref:20S pre-rRNA protein n=1 Tax=Staphylotrichum tortipilum TaxID=2831512 RepID=A0AAN6MQ45_9PEZI|nr:putative 20S pre-rRNA protein [Staphylotrichum longicolle]